MKKLPAILLFLLVVAVLAGVASFFSIRVCGKGCGGGCMSPHDSIHEQLGLTDSQRKALEPLETKYHEKREVLEGRLALANRELAEAILAEGKESDRVNACIEKIHSSMGDLQKVTIGHVFEMKEVLSPEQYRKLLQSTSDALNALDSQHGGE